MEELFEFISKTADGVFAVDGSQRIVLWNEAAENLLGWSPAETLGRTCFDVLGGRDEGGCVVCSRDCPAMRMAIDGQLVPTREVQALTKSGEPTWLSVTTVLLPTRWKEPCLLAHVFRDVSRRKGMEQVAEEILAGVARLSSLRRSAGELPFPPAPATDLLTHREGEVLRLLSEGASTEAIGRRLGISVATTRNHVQSILTKLGVHSRLEAVTLATRHGLV